MRRVRYALILLIMMALTGCKADQTIFPSLTFKPARQAEPRFTILLLVLRSADHAGRIGTYKQQTEKDTAWKNLFVVTKDDHSLLYWDRYATPEEASDNLKEAKAYRTSRGIPPFATALVIPLPSASASVGPSEWDLLNTRGAYSVIVAVFYDVPEAKYYGRKDTAVSYCRQLREKGEEAYFYHGSARSTVTVGVFPESAAQMIAHGNVKQMTILDPRIQAIIRQYEYLPVNGLKEMEWLVDSKTGKPKKVAAKPYLAHIPKK